jgi:hypothetical protein
MAPCVQVASVRYGRTVKRGVEILSISKTDDRSTGVHSNSGLYPFIDWGCCQNFGYGLFVELVVIVSRTVSHCNGSCRRMYVEDTMGIMSIRQQGRNSKNLTIQGM